MKKLLILIAFCSILCYVSKANSATEEEWVKCAYIEGEALTARLNTREAILKEVCAFYQKPIAECEATYYASSQEQQTKIMYDFVMNSTLIPKCGKIDEVK